MAKWGLAMLSIGLLLALAPAKGVGFASGGLVWGALLCFLAAGLQRGGWRKTAMVSFILSFIFCLGGFMVPTVHDEERTIAGLKALRSALNIRKADLHGRYPKDLAELTKDQIYLTSIPIVKASLYHLHDSSAVRYGVLPDDAGGWLYDNVEGDLDVGSVRVNCTHTDSNGRSWSSY